jgi:hypothetical protein
MLLHVLKQVHRALRFIRLLKQGGLICYGLGETRVAFKLRKDK